MADRGGGWAARLAAAPRAFNDARGAAAAERLGCDAALAPLVAGAAGSSPYLARLLEQEADWAAEMLAGPGPEASFAALLAPPETDGEAPPAGADLRRRKRRAALLVALADLGGLWDLGEVTGALTAFSDHAVARAFDHALGQERTGPLTGLSAAEAGLIVLAMGKGGARELNYSSDIDLILLFESEGLPRDEVQERRSRWTKVTQRAVKLLSEQTAEGYVFRVDLRLRPNPSVTPVCAPAGAAERYYESEGRTWERAAFIKARAAAGDIAAGEAFLRRLSPFVWRRHLDFAALEDINDIRAKIREAKGVSSPDDLPGFDLKLGPGGIREIEFFAQTQQLAYGGRDLALRARATCDALAALAQAGRIEPEDAAALTEDYAAHRRLEHRLQMIEDAQTHAIPVSREAREQVAALGGWPDRAAMEREVAARLREVRGRVNHFFRKSRRGAAPAVAIERTVAELPFADPARIVAMTERWALGGIAATRDQRARRKIRALTPEILKKLAVAGDADAAALQFDRFLSGLPAGVQLFSLFEANPQLLDLLSEICASAPSLADYLAHNAGVLDAVLDADFFEPPPGAAALTAELSTQLAPIADYEHVLDATRRWAKEMRFRLGVQVLRGFADAREAGVGFSNVAEACLAALKPRVEREFAGRHGPPPGRGAAVIAMGKFGSREMTASSDLDLIVVYDAAGAEQSDGPKPLATGLYFARLTQTLLSALTAPTAEGPLYEVDMRLRPSGGQGPVAVSLESFRNYQINNAWTWEHLALTRARVVAGDEALGRELDAVIDTVLTTPRDAGEIRRDVGEMRGRLAKANAAERDELWALKLAAGGLMEIELVTQAAALASARRCPRAPLDALQALTGMGAVEAPDAAALAEAYDLQSRLQQLERVAYSGAFRPDAAGAGLRAAFARVGGADSFEALEAALAARRAAASAVIERLAPIP